MKTFKVNIPIGYEIDKNKSTFEEIVFKPLKPIIRWCEENGTIEIISNNEHFFISPDPSFSMNWYDALRFTEDDNWTLPTLKQLKIISNNIDKINKIIKDNNGYILDGWLWSKEENKKHCGKLLSLSSGYVHYDKKKNYNNVRLVCVNKA